jgi:hypothetical protein
LFRDDVVTVQLGKADQRLAIGELAAAIKINETVNG